MAQEGQEIGFAVFKMMLAECRTSDALAMFDEHRCEPLVELIEIWWNEPETLLHGFGKVRIWERLSDPDESQPCAGDP